jgi:putative membrane protein insertion efficiency factor
LNVNSATASNAALDARPGTQDDPEHGRTLAHAWSPADPEPPLSPGVRVALIVLRGYKLLISPLFTGSCRFLPSCSDYAAQAIRWYGVPRGSWLALKRLARCHPFCAGGHDPVPPRN